MVRFAVLGAMECWTDQRPIQLNGNLQRTLLAALLALESKPVSTQSLVHERWGDAPPPRWENALQAHVSRLRRRIQSAAEERPVRLLTQANGYRLVVHAEAVDGTRFMRDVARARALAERNPAEAAELYRSALELWRGPAFDIVNAGPLSRAAAVRYESARLLALERFFDLELRLGRHAEVIATLHELVESASLNERFCELLMVALYRAGQQAEALAAYRRMCRRLDTELGVQPTAVLRNHERAILTHDPVLRIQANHVKLRE